MYDNFYSTTFVFDTINFYKLFAFYTIINLDTIILTLYRTIYFYTIIVTFYATVNFYSFSTR